MTRHSSTLGDPIAMPRRSASVLAVAALPLLVACGGATPTPASPVVVAKGPEPVVAVKPPAAAPVDPFAVPKKLRTEPAPKEVTVPSLPEYLAYSAKAPAPASCAKVAKTGKKTCGKTLADEFETLRKALAQSDVAKRDAALAALEGCTISDASVRAIRAEYMDASCKDAVVDPYLAALAKDGYDLQEAPGLTLTPPKKGTAKHRDVQPEVLHALVGYGVASKLSRLGAGAPTYTGSGARADVKTFIDGPYKGWLVEQVRAIDEAQAIAFKLSGYGRGVAALASGQANLRLAETFRAAPIPQDIASDPELKETYEQSLEGVVEPRKRQGRDASLVALQTLAEDGVIRSPEVDAARATLARLYAGRRIDALDGLLLPKPPATIATLHGADFGRTMVVRPPTNLTGIADALSPTLSAALPSPGPTQDALTAQLGLTGMPGRFVAFPRAERHDSMRPWLRSYGNLLLATHTWRGVGYDQVVATYISQTSFPDDETRETARFYFALALTLRNGPDSPAEMMSAKTPADLNLGHVEALDALEGEHNRFAGEAAYDAALLLETAPPEKASASFFKGLAARYRKAEGLLSAADAKAKAHDRAAAMDELAKQVATMTGGK